MRDTFSVNFLSDKEYFSPSSGSRVLIFTGIRNYEDEVLCMLENKIDYMELESIINSWGGKVEMILLDHLIRDYIKNNTDL